MPKTVNVHPSERIDKVDFEALAESARDAVAFAAKKQTIDRRDRIIDGFRVEILDQTQFPGRITIHNGVALDYEGSTVTTEDQPTASRTIFLDGTNSDFYVEIEFNEVESDVDARAFWDPTVDQGLDASGDELPDGQETSANVSTRKTPDWKVVTPVSTTGFERDQPGTLDSTRIPLVKLSTNGSNEIDSSVNTNLVTEKASTVITRIIPSGGPTVTQMVFKHPRLFVAGQAINVTDSSGTQASSIVSVDYNTGLVNLSAITPPATGAIVRVTTASAPDFVRSDGTGPYRRYEADLPSPDHVVTWQDRMFQGDEVNGRILSQGHTNFDSRSDVNLDSLKDYVDFLAGQIQELKWGTIDPFVSDTSNDRIPPGVSVSFPSDPRYFDRAGGVANARLPTITVGDGVYSFGDFNGADHTALQKALDSLPTAGGYIFVKRGNYSLTSTNIDWTHTGDVTVEGETGTVFLIDGAYINLLSEGGGITIRNITIKEDPGALSAQTGLLLGNTTTELVRLVLDSVRVLDCSFDIEGVMPDFTHVTGSVFRADNANMSAQAVIRSTATTAQLSGLWEINKFAHTTHAGVATDASLIDFHTTTGDAQNLTMDRCVFYAGSQRACYIQYFTNLTFNNCVLQTGAALLRSETSSSNLKVLGCYNEEETSKLLSCVNVAKVCIDKFRGYTVSFPFTPTHPTTPIYLEDCSQISITNCTIRVKGSVLGYPSSAGITIDGTTGSTGDIFISRNMIFGDSTNNPIGILLKSESTLTNVSIVNNDIRTCEAGIVFYTTGGANVEVANISGNTIQDGFLSGNATHQKIGVYGGSLVTFRELTVNNNKIINCNPANTTIPSLSGVTRVGIALLGTLVEGTVSGNQIQDVGDSANRTDGTYGILLGTPTSISVDNNSITSVYGAATAAAIGASTGTSYFREGTISGNKISVVSASSGGAYGIRAVRFTGVTVTGNFFETISVTTGSSAAVGINDTTNGQYFNSSFTGNVIVPQGADFAFRGFLMLVVNMVNCTFSGNSLSSNASARFIDISIGAGGTLDRVTISGNTSYGTINNGIQVLENGGDLEDLTITGNTLRAIGGQDIYVDGGQRVTISNNSMKNDGSNATDRNIKVTNVTKLIVMGNNCRYEGAGYNIEIGAGCVIYQVNHNICDRASVAGSTVDTTGSTGGAGSIAFGNSLDQAGAWNGESGVTTGSAHEVTF